MEGKYQCDYCRALRPWSELVFIHDSRDGTIIYTVCKVCLDHFKSLKIVKLLHGDVYEI